MYTATVPIFDKEIYTTLLNENILLKHQTEKYMKTTKSDNHKF